MESRRNGPQLSSRHDDDGYPTDDAGLTFGELPRVYPRLEGSKTPFSLNPGVTRDSQVTPGFKNWAGV